MREEVREIPREGFVVIATGPADLARARRARSASSSAPRTSTSTTRWRRSSKPPRSTSRRCTPSPATGRATGEDYWNCPLSRDEYERFLDALLSGETVPVKDFEKGIYFEGCLPIEVMAERGRGDPPPRADEADGAARPADGQDPVGRRAAAAGRPGQGALQPRRLPDEAEDPGAAEGLPDDPGPRERRLRALRDAPPQHLHPRARPTSTGSGGCGGSRGSSSPGRSPASRATSRARPRASRSA